MAVNPTIRPTRLPPPDIAKQPLPRVRQVGRVWFRIHPQQFGAAHFDLKPGHRYSHPKCPFGIMYSGIDPDTCLWEYFGDFVFDNGRTIPQTWWNDCVISGVTVPALSLCDLANTVTRGALTVDLSALMDQDLSVPQEWGLAIQNHPDQIPGIKYKSRFSGKACLALFDRAGIKGQLAEKRISPLNQSGWATAWLTKNNVALV